MSTRGSWITLKFRGVVDVVRASRFQSSYGGLKRNSPIVTTTRVESRNWNRNPGLQFFSTKSNTSTNANRVKWIVCSLLSFMLPLWSQSWGKLERIEGEAEIVIEGVEKVAEVVEKVATVAEKVSEDLAETLPEDAKLKKVAVVVESASKQAVHGAQITEEFIHKVEKVTNDMEELESFVEPLIDKIVKKQS
ncbi:uncharacterized protein [Medicago truncatula]|uniref:uncharacterized protein isoform X2 n=1 Tax=Medicago truncatula TaxID=3880 RepID=UPI001968967C|nr:uncharacterized protein LOC11415414 isoform X2 [Medicago truncatula]